VAEISDLTKHFQHPRVKIVCKHPVVQFYNTAVVSSMPHLINLITLLSITCLATPSLPSFILPTQTSFLTGHQWNLFSWSPDQEDCGDFTLDKSALQSMRGSLENKYA
jgi:hypothetical protein